jgi:hypothetical protein
MPAVLGGMGGGMGGGGMGGAGMGGGGFNFGSSIGYLILSGRLRSWNRSDFSTGAGRLGVKTIGSGGGMVIYCFALNP